MHDFYEATTDQLASAVAVCILRVIFGLSELIVYICVCVCVSATVNESIKLLVCAVNAQTHFVRAEIS